MPKRMDLQRLTYYSSYRSMNSLKALVGAARNGVITYASCMQGPHLSKELFKSVEF